MKTAICVSLILTFIIVVVTAELESSFGLPQVIKKWNAIGESDSGGTLAHLASQRQKRFLFRQFKDYSRDILESTNKFIKRTFGAVKEKAGGKSAAPTSPAKKTTKDSAAKTSASEEPKEDSAAKTSAKEEPKDTDAAPTSTIANEVTTTTA